LKTLKKNDGTPSKKLGQNFLGAFDAIFGAHFFLSRRTLRHLVLRFRDGALTVKGK